MNKFLIFFCLFFIVSIILVSGLSISPGEVNFAMGVNQKECKKITLGFSEGEANLRGEDKWTDSIVNRGEMSKYTFDSVILDVEYPIDVEFNEDGNSVELCITGREVGQREGILIYDSNDGGGTSVAVGTWISVNIKDDLFENQESGSNKDSRSNGIQVESDDEKILEEEGKTEEINKRSIEEISAKVVEHVSDIEDEKPSIVYATSVLVSMAIIIIIVSIISWRRKK